jgi:hypothetical protein
MRRLRRVTITAIGHELLKRTVSNLKRRVQTLREPTKRQRGRVVAGHHDAPSARQKP